MSEGSFWPTSWREAVPLLVWAVLIFAFGFEGVASLIQGQFLQAFFGFGGMVGLTAMLIHWTKIKEAFGSIRWLVMAATVALVVVALSPFVEQHRWPFSRVFHDPPSTEDIAKAIAPVEAKLKAANQQLADTKQQLQNILHPPPPPMPPPPPKPHYTAGEIEIMQTALRGMYAVLTTHCKPAADVDYHLASLWPQSSINNDPRDFVRQLVADRDSIQKCSAELHKIVDDNGLYANELNEAMSNDYGVTLSAVLDIIIRDLTELGKSPVKLDAQMLLHDTISQWVPSSGSYSHWVGTATNSVTKKIDELRNWRND